MPESVLAGFHYTMGYEEDFGQMLYRRNAQTHAAHLLPYLTPGMRVLDFGCGPGAISVGLAEAVAPADFYGVDIEASQIEMARRVAAAGGNDNAVFLVGDVTDLPFGDNSFDVAHCHAVLTHMPNTADVLAEVRRVLKPGGIISCRELIGESSFSAPAPDLKEGWRVFWDLIAANGGHPQMGKEIKGRLVEAGFADIRATASFEVFSTADEVAFFHQVIKDWFFSSKVEAEAIEYGLATPQQFAQWRQAHGGWGRHPGAMAVWAFGEAIAFKP